MFLEKLKPLFDELCQKSDQAYPEGGMTYRTESCPSNFIVSHVRGRSNIQAGDEGLDVVLTVFFENATIQCEAPSVAKFYSVLEECGAKVLAWNTVEMPCCSMLDLWISDKEGIVQQVHFFWSLD